jgi:hypothetical protein
MSSAFSSSVIRKHAFTITRKVLRADWSRVFAEVAHLDKAVEVDGYANQQDLKMSLLGLARTEGCEFLSELLRITPWRLVFMNFSLVAARLVGFPEDRILNVISTEELRSWATQISARN